jgi:uncharacterized lipoprotein YddW (UPF0748 family)
MISALTLAAVLLGGASVTHAAAEPHVWSARDSDDPPPLATEFRGVWIATVANIDWPSRPGLSTWEQQAELIALLNRAVSMNLNAVIFQVRPAGDALYASTLEPWSAYLTGQMGAAPEPFYDPLTFAIDEAHARGLELHAWFNPYRARHPSDSSEIATTHISARRPHLVKPYGPYLWMDPGEPEIVAHTKRVILDVVSRYDVDGIHIDDYFYPYLERDSFGALIPFPDEASWRRYVASGGALNRGDWRRQNVDRLVAELYFAVHAQKPWVKFGVSPFGIWRPDNPPGVTGLDAYTEIFADARKWVNNGWLDYVAPQLYWRSASPGQPFDRLLAWWVDQNIRRRHVWPGLFTSRSDTLETQERWRATEIVEQLRLTRAVRGASGHIHFSMRAFRDNPDSLSERLREPYRNPALVPATPWVDSLPPAAPQVLIARDTVTGGLVAHLRPGSDEKAWLWGVRERRGATWVTRILPGWQLAHTLTYTRSERGPEEIVVNAVDRSSNVSASTRRTVPAVPGA